MASHLLRTQEWTLRANTSYIQALGEEKSLTLISLNIDISSGNVWGELIGRPFTLNTFKEVEQDQNRAYHIAYKIDTYSTLILDL